jgi:hypothetical protein
MAAFTIIADTRVGKVGNLPTTGGMANVTGLGSYNMVI